VLFIVSIFLSLLLPVFASDFQRAQEGIQSRRTHIIQQLEMDFISAQVLSDKIDIAAALLDELTEEDERVEYYMQIVELSEHVTEDIRLKRAKIYFDNADYNRASKELTGLKGKTAVEYLVQCAVALENYRDAKRYFQQLVKQHALRTLRPQVVFDYAQMLKSTGELHRAIPYFEHVVKDYPLNPPSVKAFHELERLKSSGGFRIGMPLIRSLAINSNLSNGVKEFVNLMLSRELIIERGAEVTDAHKAFFLMSRGWTPYNSDLFELNPQNRRDLIFFARVMAIQGESTQALKFLLKQYRQQPHRQFKNEVARVLKTDGYLQGALHLYSRVKQSFVGTVSIWDRFWLSYKLGKKDEAMSILRSNRQLKDPHYSFFRDYWDLRLAESSDYKNIFMRDDQGFYGILSRLHQPELSENDIGTDRIRPLKADYPMPFEELVRTVSNHFSLDPLLLLSIMRAESRYNPNATSWVGAQGLLQVMPKTAIRIASLVNDSQLSTNQLSDPQVNILYGGFYLAEMIKLFGGNVFLGVAAYNAGPIAVNDWLKNCQNCLVDEFVEQIPYRETRRYVKKVVGYYRNYYLLYQNKLPQFHTLKLPQVLPDSMDLF
jgi:soluble lytic murein transglycosylase-like protein